MKKEEMKELVRKAYEGYLSMTDEEDKIVIDLNGFDYLDECKNDEGDLDIELITQLNEMLIELFRENGYDVYTAGNFYAEDGQFKNVNPDTAIAIK